MDLGMAVLHKLPSMEPASGDRKEFAARRKKIGVGPVEFAERADVSRQTLEDFEEGNRRPQDKTLRKLWDALLALEEETGHEPVTDEEGRVTFRISGNFGVTATVQGPVGEIDRLEQSAARLLRQAMDAERQVPPGES